MKICRYNGCALRRVAGIEHASISPQPHRVVVWFDDGGEATVAALHIASVEKESAHAA